MDELQRLTALDYRMQCDIRAGVVKLRIWKGDLMFSDQVQIFRGASFEAVVKEAAGKLAGEMAKAGQ